MKYQGWIKRNNEERKVMMKIHTNHAEGLVILKDSLAQENDGVYNLYGDFLVHGNVISVFGMSIGNQSSHRILDIDFISKGSTIEGFEKISIQVPSGYFEIIDGDSNVDKYLSYPCVEEYITIHLRDEGIHNILDILIER